MVCIYLRAAAYLGSCYLPYVYLWVTVLVLMAPVGWFLSLGSTDKCFRVVPFLLGSC